MPTPDPPSVSSSPPHIADDEGAAAVLAEDGRAHGDALNDTGAVAGDVDKSLLQLVLMDDVVREDREPAFAWHDRGSRVNEHERVVVLEQGVRGLRIAPLNAALELLHSSF